MRESNVPQKGKNGKGGGLAAILKAKDGDLRQPETLQFDEKHFQKFLKEDQGESEDVQNDSIRKRKRQNILGDFKFKKIDELF